MFSVRNLKNSYSNLSFKKSIINNNNTILETIDFKKYTIDSKGNSIADKKKSVEDFIKNLYDLEEVDSHLFNDHVIIDKITVNLDKDSNFIFKSPNTTLTFKNVNEVELNKGYFQPIFNINPEYFVIFDKIYKKKIKDPNEIISKSDYLNDDQVMGLVQLPQKQFHRKEIFPKSNNFFKDGLSFILNVPDNKNSLYYSLEYSEKDIFDDNDPVQNEFVYKMFNIDVKKDILVFFLFSLQTFTDIPPEIFDIKFVYVKFTLFKLKYKLESNKSIEYKVTIENFNENYEINSHILGRIKSYLKNNNILNYAGFFNLLTREGYKYVSKNWKKETIRYYRAYLMDISSIPEKVDLKTHYDIVKNTLTFINFDKINVDRYNNSLLKNRDKDIRKDFLKQLQEKEDPLKFMYEHLINNMKSFFCILDNKQFSI